MPPVSCVSVSGQGRRRTWPPDLREVRGSATGGDPAGHTFREGLRLARREGQGILHVNRVHLHDPHEPQQGASPHAGTGRPGRPAPGTRRQAHRGRLRSAPHGLLHGAGRLGRRRSRRHARRGRRSGLRLEPRVRRALRTACLALPAVAPAVARPAQVRAFARSPARHARRRTACLPRARAGAAGTRPPAGHRAQRGAGRRRGLQRSARGRGPLLHGAAAHPVAAPVGARRRACVAPAPRHRGGLAVPARGMVGAALRPATPSRLSCGSRH